MLHGSTLRELMDSREKNWWFWLLVCKREDSEKMQCAFVLKLKGDVVKILVKKNNGRGYKLYVKIGQDDLFYDDDGKLVLMWEYTNLDGTPFRPPLDFQK
jgi:hypothetical protein